MATRAKTAAAAVDAPETAENAATAKIVAIARPPGIQPIHAFAASNSDCVMPA